MTLESLKPTRKDKVFDLVEEAGFDTSDWVASAHNCPIKANPKYCYEWAFVEPGKVAILNLWWDMFEEMPDGSITHRHNFRADAAGADIMQNVAALCPNDHKKAHFAAERATMREELLGRIL